MNRCLRFLSTPAHTLRAAFVTSALLILANSGFAQEAVRPFPAAAKRATLQVTYPPEILLNGRPARLSPGARIRGTNNMLMVSGALAGQNVLVNYVRDPQGMVKEVWVLNATEAKQPMDGATLPPNYVTDGVTASGEADSTTTSSTASADGQ
jgi:hypothetical protein